MKDRFTLRQKILLGFLLFTCLPSLLILFFTGVSSQVMLKKHAKKDIVDRANILAVEVAREFGNREFLQDLSEDLYKKYKMQVTIVDRNGVVLADPRPEMVGKPYFSMSRGFMVPGDTILSMRKQRFLELPRSSGEDREILITPVTDGRGALLGAIIIPGNLKRSGIIYVLNHLFLFWMVLLCFVLAAATSYALYLGYQVTSPLEALEEGARALKEGKFSHRLKVSSRDELGLVAETFNEMAERIEEHYSRLEGFLRYTRAILDSMESVVIVVRKNGSIKTVNRAACDFLGYSEEEMAGLEIDDLWPGFSALRNQIPPARGGDCLRLPQVYFITRDGKRMPAMANVSETVLEGEYVYLVVASDLRNIIYLQEKIRQERELLFVTLASIGEGVIVADLEGKVLLMNRAAERLTGYKLDEVRGKPTREVVRLLDERTLLPFSDPIERVLETRKGMNMSGDLLLLSRDGNRVSVAVSVSPIRGEEGKVMGAVLVLRDVTEEKILQREMINRGKLESVSLLARGLAHDFNNLLAGIVGNLDLAQLFLENKDQAQVYISDAQKAALRATHLTQQLLAFAKSGEPIKEVSSVRELVEDSARFVTSGSKVKCEFQFAPDLWLAEVDMGKIGQVVQNLVINAIQAMPRGGKIVITGRNVSEEEAREKRLEPPGPYIELAFHDEGIGIPRENLDKIFSPYFTTKEGGSGLGLAICYSVVKGHGGHIRVESEPGKGTTFYVYLPAMPYGRVEESSQKLEIRRGKGERVLVVDDEEVIRRMLSNILTELGYRCDAVEDGKKAVEKYREAMIKGEPYHLVIMDLTIPGGMGGVEATKRILEIDPHARVIISSGYTGDPVLTDYRRYGFRGYIKKPYTTRDVAIAVTRALQV